MIPVESFQLLFQLLRPDSVLLVFFSILLERNIIFHCEHRAFLTPVMETLKSLLFPLTWVHTYVPIFPEGLSLEDSIGAPTPFVFGTDSARFNECQIDDACIIVDLNVGTVMTHLGKTVQPQTTVLPSKSYSLMLNQLNNEQKLNKVFNPSACAQAARSAAVGQSRLSSGRRHAYFLSVLRLPCKIAVLSRSTLPPEQSTACSIWHASKTAFSTFLFQRLVHIDSIWFRMENPRFVFGTVFGTVFKLSLTAEFQQRFVLSPPKERAAQRFTCKTPFHTRTCLPRRLTVCCRLFLRSWFRPSIFPISHTIALSPRKKRTKRKGISSFSLIAKLLTLWVNRKFVSWTIASTIQSRLSLQSHLTIRRSNLKTLIFTVPPLRLFLCCAHLSQCRSRTMQKSCLPQSAS
jgi:hypothetical protein